MNRMASRLLTISFAVLLCLGKGATSCDRSVLFDITLEYNARANIPGQLSQTCRVFRAG